ncbi:MAG TPA: hypothetical protein VGO69_09315 [Pyrinomonadaceae bacterium]|nr:hypothetical protein [Pyrinomonadaceae bacterium]
MTDEAPTKPTLETLSRQMNDLRSEMHDGFAEMRAGFSAINHMLEQMDIRLDRIESIAYGAHSQVVNLRADFKEFRSRFKAPA